MTFKELGSIPRLSRPGNLNSKFHKFLGSVHILHLVLIIKWQNLRSLPLPFWTCHSPFKLGQPLHHVNICRMKFGQTAIQHCQQIRFDNAKHRLGLGHGSTGPTSLLDAVFFSTGATMAQLCSMETIQQRPLLFETRLLDSGVGH